MKLDAGEVIDKVKEFAQKSGWTFSVLESVVPEVSTRKWRVLVRPTYLGPKLVMVDDETGKVESVEDQGTPIAR